MDILGISAWDGPSAACLVRDGRIVAAVREDLLSRRPGDAAFPRRAAEYCLRAGKIGAAGLDAAVVSGRRAYPPPARGASSLLRRITGRAGGGVEKLVRAELDAAVSVRLVDSLRAHALSAFLTSPFDEAAVVVCGPDGCAIARGAGATIEAPETDVPPDPAAAVDAARRRTGLDRVAVGGPALSPRGLAAALADRAGDGAVWVQPAAAGADALGAALDAADGRSTVRALGPGYNTHEVRTFLRTCRESTEELPRDEVATRTAALLADGVTVAWFAGRIDFDDEPVAARALLALPGRTEPGPDSVIVVPREASAEMLQTADGLLSPLAPARLRGELRDRLGEETTTVPLLAYRVDAGAHRALHAVLRAVESSAGVPALVARPLVRPGEPVACTPRDAYAAYRDSEAGALVMERHLVRRS